MFGQGSTLHQLSCLLLPGWAPFLFILRLTQVSSNFFSFSLFFSLSLFFLSECPFLFILRLKQVSLFTDTFFFIYKHKCHWISLHFYFSPYLKFYKISLNLVSLFSSSENSFKCQWILIFLKIITNVIDFHFNRESTWVVGVTDRICAILASKGKGISHQMSFLPHTPAMRVLFNNFSLKLEAFELSS